jgi:hypothetical protein
MTQGRPWLVATRDGSLNSNATATAKHRATTSCQTGGLQYVPPPPRNTQSFAGWPFSVDEIDVPFSTRNHVSFYNQKLF